MKQPALIWFRRDLRLQDNTALRHALLSGRPVEALYLHAPQDDDDWPAGAASRWYLHHSLLSLQQDLAHRGVNLHLRQGRGSTELLRFCEEQSVAQVFWNSVEEPAYRSRDSELQQQLTTRGIDVSTFHDDSLLPAGTVCKADGSPYRVFTPFWKNALEIIERTDLRLLLQPLPRPAEPACRYDSADVDSLDLLDTHRWHDKLATHWQPGEAAALQRLEHFTGQALADYDEQRDIPAIDGTSRLSAALHFGEISVNRVFASAQQAMREAGSDAARRSIRRFLSEIGWREFARHVLHTFPQTPLHSLDERFEHAAAWKEHDEAALAAWQQGRTGITLVDAGMQELWQTGWMHNRVRMVVASFLTKNLGIHWLTGARWFWDTLVDADLASNTLGWQWVAGCGTDAAPYYRIFNPDTQAEKFDPGGEYRRRWLKNHPPPLSPIVDLKDSRQQALARFQALKHL